MAEETIEVPTATIDVAKEVEKPRLEALLFAEYGAIALDKKGLVCGIFDRLFVSAEKKETGLFYLFVRTCETLDDEIRIRIFSPDNNLLAVAESGEVQNPEVIKKEPPRHLQVLHRLSLKTPLEGIYWFEVLYKGQSLGGTPLIVMFKQEDENVSEHA